MNPKPPTLRIDIISVQPDLLHSPFQHSIMKRAQEKGLLEVVVHDLKKYGHGKHNQVDDYQYGGGAGMVMMIEPVDKCIQQLKQARDYDEVIYLSPDGELLDQHLANQLSLSKAMIFLCGHYKGIDERIREHLITREVSIGNYVLSGGELGAAVLVDTIGRLIPGVLNNEVSALEDSFQDDLVAPPVYTRPELYKDWSVPPVLISGHAAKIEEWRRTEALKRTAIRRPELYQKWLDQKL